MAANKTQHGFSHSQPSTFLLLHRNGEMSRARLLSINVGLAAINVGSQIFLCFLVNSPFISNQLNCIHNTKNAAREYLSSMNYRKVAWINIPLSDFLLSFLPAPSVSFRFQHVRERRRRRCFLKHPLRSRFSNYFRNSDFNWWRLRSPPRIFHFVIMKYSFAMRRKFI